MAGANLGGVLRHLRKLVGARPDVDELSDAHLLDRFATVRDESAFAELVRRHGPMVLGVGRSVLNDAHAAEDVFQATFVVLAKKAATVRKQDSVGSWLYGVAYRVARNARVSAARRRERERQTPGASAAAAGEEAMNRELRPLFAEEINQLPEKYRAPLVLCYLEGKTNEEAAQELRWPSGTIKGRLARAREVLRDRLARRGLALSLAALGVELNQTVQAALPAALAEQTVRAAALFAAGGAAAATAAPAPVLALCHQALREMLMIRLKYVAAGFMVAALLGTGVSWAALRAPAGGKAAAPAKPAPQAKEKDPEPAAEVAEVGDPKDEPVPDGARGRVGSLRLRHAGSIQALGFTPSLERPYIASASADGTIGVWDSRTGKEVRRFETNTRGNGVFMGSGTASLAISPNGDRLVGAGMDNTVTVWDIDSGKQLHRLSGTRVAYSPNGKLIATAGAEQHQVQQNQGNQIMVRGGSTGIVRIYDAESGKELRKLESKDFSTYEALAFSPDSKQVFTVGGNMDLLGAMPAPGMAPKGGAQIGGGFAGLGGGGFNVNQKQIIRAWDVETGKQVRQFSPRKGGVMALAFSPDGKLLATGGNPNGQVFGALAPENAAPITLWDPATGKERGTLKGNGGAVTGLSFSLDGKYLASSGVDRMIRLWDAKSLKEVGRATGSRTVVNCLAFGPDGQTLASGGHENVIRLWDVPALKERPIAQGHDAAVAFIAFTPDGKRMITGASGDALHVWDPASGRRLHKLPETYIIGQGAALSPDGSLLLAGTSDQAIKFYSTETGKEVRRLGNRKATLTAAAFAPDGKTAVVSYHVSTKNNITGEVKLWNLETGKEVRSYTTKAKAGIGVIPWADAIAFSVDGKTLAMQWLGDNLIHLVDVTSGKELRTLGTADAGMAFSRVGTSAMVFSPDGRFLAVGQANAMKNLGAPGLVGGFGGIGNGFPGVAVNPEKAGGVILWDVTTGKEVAHFGKENVRSLAFSPDARSLATADGSSAEVTVWEVASRKERCRFKGSRDGITALSFSPDGRLLASGGQDTSVVLWEFLAANKAAAPTDARAAADLWDRLAGEDATAAYQASTALAAAPKPLVALLKERLKPAPNERDGQVPRWIDDLDSDQFDVREAATSELTKRGTAAAEALRGALKAPGLSLEKRRRIERVLEKINAEALPPDGLRELRAIELLEHLGTTEARELLDTLAGGAEGSRLTTAAKAARQRLKNLD